MPREPKQTPIKMCEWCGMQFARARVGKRNQLECVSNFLRRRFCSISCSVLRQHATEPPTIAAARKRAQKLLSGPCEACGATVELCVHHINGNAKDNDPTNLQRLCMNCHSFWHAVLRRTGRECSKPMPRLIEWACCGGRGTPSALKSRRNSSAPTARRSER